VAIARALVADPAVVWADEPTGNLDSQTAASVLSLFEEVHAAGQTLVVVTHDPSIGALADRVVTVSDGRVVGSEWRRGRRDHLAGVEPRPAGSNTWPAAAGGRR
jgi:putative ABC transport system ATP-binding protein